MLKNTPYQTLINAYPHDTELLEEVFDKERQAFSTVCLFLVLDLMLEKLTCCDDRIRTQA
jgi:hypothetical protein